MRMICNKAKECIAPCDDAKPHELDGWCTKKCDGISGIKDAICVALPKSGSELIADERQRQIEVEGWSIDHDDCHTKGQMAIASMCYIADIVSCYPKVSDNAEYWRIGLNYWPWDKKWWKPTPDNFIRQLTKAGALIAAEIDRLQREKDKQNV